MQNKPISALTEATSVSASDTAVIVQGGVTKKVTAERLAGAGSALYATAEQGALADTAQQPPSEGPFVDGDKTKLDGIEAGATADQTGAEIKTALFAEADTNNLTDALLSKLNGIEAGADVTDTANVTAAGALMDSEVTNLAAVKAFDPADYATAAQGGLADSATQPGDLATVATSGDYDDLSNRPTLGTMAAEDAGNYVSQTAATGAAVLPSGTEAQRPGSPVAGHFRFNTTAGAFEGHDGSNWGPLGAGAGSFDVQTFTSSGTWTKPAGTTFVMVELIAGGGGGANQTASGSAAGGAGGEYVSYIFLAADLGATETVTIGAGGLGGANGGNNNGSVGGDTTFGSHATAKGGNGAVTGSGGSPGRALDTTTSDNAINDIFIYTAGPGGLSAGHNSVLGGAGGGGGASIDRPGGVSEFAGNGGTGRVGAGVKGDDGENPGGGGGGSQNDGGGGDGGDGWCRVISW